MTRTCERTAKANTYIPQSIAADLSNLRPGSVIPCDLKGRHYDVFIADDLITAQKDMNGNLAAQAEFYARLIKQSIKEAQAAEETRMAQQRKDQVEIYSNVIEAKYGVKLCVAQKHDSDMTQMLLLVPNKLFADDQGKESLAEALHNIAMFIMSME
jgi:hypothetical protein